MIDRIVVKRNKTEVDTGTMGFHDYETRWESIEDFTERVCNEINKIVYSGSGWKKYYNSYFLSNSDGITDCAVIVYDDRMKRDGCCNNCYL